MTKISSFKDRLAKACSGLIYISETDATITPIFFGDLKEISPHEIKRSLGLDENSMVVETDEAEFFCRLTQQKDWHGPVEKKRARDFSRLRTLLEKELTDLKAFRIGTVNIEIFVLGRADDGNVLGIRTHSVET